MGNLFANALKKESEIVYTENGMQAQNTTHNACVNLFGLIGALRHQAWNVTTLDFDRAEVLFAEAYKEDPLVATKIVFYARDIRGGIGERDIPRHLFKYMANYHENAIIPNLDLIGVYGRYDDLYTFIGTPVEGEMWGIMKKQFEEDRENMANGHAISLLAKWIKTPDASSKKTRALGIMTANKLGYSVYEFKRILRAMRKHIGVVESLMCNNEWDKISYPKVPSRAMMIYRNAFRKHDKERYSQFVLDAFEKRVKINSSALYPYDIVEKFLYKGEDAMSLEAQWKQLPNYVDSDEKIMIMADVSGSMWGRPMATSIGLAMYFAERNKGDFHNLFMTFSNNPTIVDIKGETLGQKIQFIHNADWGNSTNIEAAFDLILNIAKNNNTPKSDMPKALIIVTDMEFNYMFGSESALKFYDAMKEKFEKHGYTIPNVVFWNVDSRQDLFHGDSNINGVQFVSGQSASTFKWILGGLDMTAYEMMMNVIASERYSAITIA